MLKFHNFIKEEFSNRESMSNKRISNFKDFKDKDTKFIKELLMIKMGVDDETKLKSNDILKLLTEFKEFKNEATFLRKEQKYIPLFFRIKFLEDRSNLELEDLYKSIQKHRNTIKQNDIDFTKFKTFEEIIDELAVVELIEKTNKFLKLLPRHLRNDLKNDKYLLKEFSNKLVGYNYNDYKNVFLKKVSSYRNVEDFLQGLDDHLKGFINKSEIYEEIEKNPAAEIVHSEEDFVIARIYSKQGSIDLGSPQWCISYNNSNNYWDSYISRQRGGFSTEGERPGVQYFIWDFRESGNMSKVGVTIYRNGNFLAHNKVDSSVKNEAKNKDWFKYLKPFDELSESEKVRLVADNPEMEKYTNTINSLDNNKRRELLDKVPKLLLYFNDLSFLTNDEIWELVKKDITLCTSESIAKELNDEQKLLMVVKNPDLLELKWENNPYLDIVDMINDSQKIQMISIKHSLYEKFKLTEEQIFILIQKDPSILVSYTNIAHEVDQKKLREFYLNDKDRWDSIISRSKSDTKVDVELILQHLIKDDDRIDMEEHNNCFVVVAAVKEINGEKYLIPDENEIIYVEDILSPKNSNIAVAMLSANFDPDLEGYSTWVPKDLLSLDELDSEDKYKFKSSIEDLVGGNAEPKEQEIYNNMVKSFKELSF